MTQQVSMIYRYILWYEMIYDLSINPWDPFCCICSPHFDSSSVTPVTAAKRAEASHKKKHHCYSFSAIGDVAYSFVVCSTAGLRTWMVTRILDAGPLTICHPKSKALLRHPTERLQEPGNMENRWKQCTSKNRSSIPNPRVDCVSISIQSQNLTDTN